jgi:hypothetical protein
VHVVDPIEVLWGDWSVVEASLRALQLAAHSVDPDWVVFLSGEDRPVVDLDAWEQRALTSQVDGIVDARALTTRPAFGRRPTADDLNFARYAYRWRRLPAAGDGVMRPLLEAARRLSRYSQPVFKIEYAGRRGGWFVGTPRRQRLAPGWTIYTGAQWMALGRRAIGVVLETDPSVEQWFRSTWIPDQAFFHTVLYNRPELTLRNERMTYVVPHRTARQRPQWMTLRREDFDGITHSGAAFARKFDPEVDPGLVGMIDAAIDSERAADPPARRDRSRPAR